MSDVVIITGGSAGIGRAVARVFAGEGAAIGLIARGAERLADAHAELSAMGVRVHTVSADVADAAAMEAAAAEIEAALGPVTIWVNNAMATVYAPIAQVSEDEIRRVTEVTYLGGVNGIKAALRRMEGRGGRIVQVSSVLAWRAMPIQGPYCAAKFALRGFVESLRSELIHDRSKVKISMVHLPAVNTPQFGWARNKTGRATRAPSTIYTPDTAAQAIHFAARHQRRDVFVGRSTPLTILASRFAPSTLDYALAWSGYRAQLGEAAPPQDGNLYEPVPGHQEATGPFVEQAQDDPRQIYTSREAGGLRAALLTLGLLGVAALVPRRGRCRTRATSAVARSR